MPSGTERPALSDRHSADVFQAEPVTKYTVLTVHMSWTESKKMKLNIKKTKNLVFNFSKNNQFSTDVKLGSEVVETMKETKLFGTILTDNLSWNTNTNKIVKETNRRMQMLHKASKFTNNTKDLKQIYMLQIRSKLDQSAVLWHSSLTKKNRDDLERVQKSAVKCILGRNYQSYEEGLERLGLETLERRRDQMCLKFAKQCLKIDKMKKFFGKNYTEHSMMKRDSNAFKVVRAQTERYRKSAIPFMIRMLNSCESEKRKLLKQLDPPVPVNYGSASPYHCDNGKQK